MTEKEFFHHQPLAIFGVSSSGKGFGYTAFGELRKIGMKVYAINPKGGSAHGVTIYQDLKELPEKPQAAVILTKGESAITAVENCSHGGIDLVWLQMHSNTDEVRQLCKELKIKVMTGPCILLPVAGFPHNIHRFFHNLFSSYKS
jgi:predicted CoA-binding protein